MLNMKTLMPLLRKQYKTIFEDNWPFRVGGVLIALVSIMTFIFDRPWGVVGGIRHFGDWFFYRIGLYEMQPLPFMSSTSNALTLGLILGAMIAAFMARQFAFRRPPMFELVKGAVGGVLLGIGATFAGGCNVGGFYSALSAHSMSAIAMMVGLMFGAFIGLKYLVWELEHLHSAGSGSNVTAGAPKAGQRHFQPLLGLLLVLSALLLYKYYTLDGYVIPGGLLLCGMTFGFILHRSRLCFARCFREPFMTGDPSATQAVIISLLVSVLGFAIIKWSGLRGEYASVPSTFGIGGLVGGFVFGFGMLLAGGCGSGCVWRAAEGQIKLIVALCFYAGSASLTRTALHSAAGFQHFLGHKVYLPEHFGYAGSTVFISVILLAWYVAVSWNEETERMVVQI